MIVYNKKKRNLWIWLSIIKKMKPMNMIVYKKMKSMNMIVYNKKMKPMNMIVYNKKNETYEYDCL